MSSEIEGIPLTRLLRGAMEPMTEQVPFGGSQLLTPLLILAVLILINAFFAASEIAIISVNEPKIKRMAEEGDKRAQKLLRLTQDNSRFLATIQIGVTLAGFLSSASAAQSFAAPLAQMLSFLPFTRSAVQNVATVLVTILLSYFSLVFGELVPKKLAMQCAEKLALRVAGFLQIIATVCRPFVWILSVSANAVTRLLGFDPHAEISVVTEEDILSMVDEGEETGVLEESTKDMISNIFDFNDTTVGALMTHRTEVVAVEDTATVHDVVTLAIEEGYSRIPVYHEDIDNIRGILYVKDMLRFVGEAAESVSIIELMHEAYYIPEVKKCSELFTEMTAKKLQMAVVCDEYGGTSGIITMEDLIESIVGNIQDEYDDETEEISRVSENVFTVEGSTAIDEISELIEDEIPEGDYDTIAGFLVEQLGRIPQQGEHPIVEFGRATFTVQEIEDRRISQVRIEKHPTMQIEDENG